MIAKYIIPGEPNITINVREVNRRCLNSHAQNKVKTQLILENQHEGPILQGPIHMEVDFYTTCKKHTMTIDRLLRFLNESCSDIVFSGLIESLITHKYYDVNPRTEFIIKEIRK